MIRATVTAHERGHATYWDGAAWRYQDNDEPCEAWGGEPRPCVGCGELPTAEGYDACLGRIEGMRSVCCGHGVHEAYGR